MIEIGENAGREVVCLLTDMDQPLGAAVGNALEVREALDTVRGHGPADFTELVLDACAKLLALSDLGIDEAEGRRRAESAVADGSAETTWRRWIEAQGGTADESALPARAGRPRATAADRRLRLELSAIDVGNAAVHLGAGRRTKEDPDRPRGRDRLPAKRGDRVEVGQTLAEVHARTEAEADEAAREVLAAYEICRRRPSSGPCCSRSSARTTGANRARTRRVRRCQAPAVRETRPFTAGARHLRVRRRGRTRAGTAGARHRPGSDWDPAVYCGARHLQF